MTRDDLKEGMIIEERDGDTYEILADRKVVYLDDKCSFWCYLDNYEKDLTDSYNCDWDIVKVYDKDMNLLWDRNGTEVAEMSQEKIKQYKAYYEKNPIQFIEDFLEIKLTVLQKSVLSKVIENGEK